MRLIDADDRVVVETISLANMSVKHLWKRIRNEKVIEAIPISWLTSKGMAMISNESRTELFKLIRAWREDQEEMEKNGR